MEAQIVLASKTDGYLYFGVDYRRLEAAAMWYVYTIPWLQECIDCLYEVVVFSTADFGSELWQAEIGYEDRDKNGFTLDHGPYCLVRMLC